MVCCCSGIGYAECIDDGWASKMSGITSENELALMLGQCAARDAKALRTLYEATASLLFGIALRLLRNRPQAEETLQEAFLQIWRNAGQFDASRGSAKAWMIGIVRYRALDRLEGEKRHVSTDEFPDIAADTPVAVEDGRALISCMEELPETWRRSVMMSYVEGYSHTEIAELTTTPLGTVKSWIARSLDLLKKCLER